MEILYISPTLIEHGTRHQPYSEQSADIIISSK